MDTLPSTALPSEARIQVADHSSGTGTSSNNLVKPQASGSGGEIASPVKRGRGRPKKNPEGSVVAPCTSVKPTVKREREKVHLVDPLAVPMSVEGRQLEASVGGTTGPVDSGKPHPAEGMITIVGKLTEQVAIGNTEGGLVPVKRKRGRPKKEGSGTLRKNPLTEDISSKPIAAPCVSTTTPVSSSSVAPPSKGGTAVIVPAKRPTVAETEPESPPPTTSSQQPAALKQHRSDEVIPAPLVEPPVKKERPRTQQLQPDGMPKRGRPKKRPLPPDTPDGEPVVKRKRGRPRKHPLPPEPLDGEPVVKRKRGRPRKHPLPPEGQPVVKRKRGRPRKQPLPQLDSEAMDTESDAQPTAVASSEQVVMHGKEGQPQKIGAADQQQQVVAAPVKRGRGRPRKNPLPEVKNGHGTPTSSPVVKKGRGRPRKNPQELLHPKRGRPRKTIPMVTVVAETTETSEVNVDTIEGSENVPPRTKGRFRLEVSFSESDSEGELEMGREAIKALADRVAEGSPRVNIDPDFEESFDESSST